MQCVGLTPLSTHIGQRLPVTVSPDMKGAAAIFDFLKENKRQFHFRMNLEAADVVTKSDVLKALNSLPKMLIGRHVW